jgi:hypothetical protein
MSRFLDDSGHIDWEAALDAADQLRKERRENPEHHVMDPIDVPPPCDTVAALEAENARLRKALTIIASYTGHDSAALVAKEMARGALQSETDVQHG